MFVYVFLSLLILYCINTDDGNDRYLGYVSLYLAYHVSEAFISPRDEQINTITEIYMII